MAILATLWRHDLEFLLRSSNSPLLLAALYTMEATEIHIHALEVLACVGVTENERAKGQRLVVNVTVWLRERFAGLNDDITRTANYSAMGSEVQELARARSYNLIETFADAIAARLIDTFPLNKAVVEVRKFVLPGAEYVSVTAVQNAT